MLETVFVVVHAVAGVVALAAAVVAWERPPHGLRVMVGGLGVMLVALVGAVASSWATVPPTVRVVFVALTLLAVVVLGRGVEAARRRADGPRSRGALTFVVISLADAFLVVLVLDLGAPVWAVVATGVLVAVVASILLGARLRVLEVRS